MPIYVFRCAQCGHRFEELLFSAAAADKLVCPQCRSAELVREMSAFATTSTHRSATPTCPVPT